MKVLVTGSNGFIGRHVVRRLVSLGEEVACLVRPTSDVEDLARMGVEFRVGDVRDRESLSDVVGGVDAIYHLAGVGASGDMQAVNVGGVENVVDACAARETPPVFVLVSSLAAAGPAPDATPHTEALPAAPISEYGRSKLAGEQAARARAERVPLSIVRPPVVFGEHDRDTLELFRLAARGWHLVPTLQDHHLSLVHASDLAHLLQVVADMGERAMPGGPPDQGLYYACCDERPSFAELGPMLARAMGCEAPRVVKAPEQLAWGIAAFSELAGRVLRRPSLLNLDKIREATAGSWTCSGSKAREQLGVRFRMTLQERLDQTARWYADKDWL